MEDCVFCRIIEGSCPGSFLYEDELIAGYLTTGPVTQGHAMPVEKKHVPSLADLDKNTGKHLFSIRQRTAESIRQSGIKCEGINLFLADGEAAFQEIFRLHMHIFPWNKGDSFRLDTDCPQKPPRSELDRVAEIINASYEKIWK